jgi:(1->4)-alpha-D-glucan 1-alpha-D-glucosylmutase
VSAPASGAVTHELRATYRLQLTSEFGFAAARSLIPYLRDLGISHLYLSPSLQARPGSGHGYDVIDPGQISDELGGELEFRSMANAARGAGMGVVLDVVPNHMAADDANRYWADPELRARFFDIDPVTGRHRRFFDVDDLAGVRQEDEVVFEQTHALVLSLVAEGLVDGLRIDHPDGLADPAGYLARLRDRGAARVWVEKILDPGERLREWPVSGTVGYEFLNDACALFVDPDAELALTTLWNEISGDDRGFAQLALEAKLEQARGTFAPEVERLARELDGDAPPGGIDALSRAVASFPVYRSYVDPARGLVDEQDAAAVARAQMPPTLAEMLLLKRAAPAAFVTRFQQTTPAVMAKGVEDTAFYRYARLVALAEVGGDPGRFGVSVADFHAANAERMQRFPLALLTTMTHDAKRSADVRARIAALASMPGQWSEHVQRWLATTEPLRRDGAPDDLERYFLFQTLVGAWPIELERIEAYMKKALREAKRDTDWVDQNADWEGAVAEFCRGLYSNRAFLDDFEPFVAEVAPVGDRISLGMVALKLTAPGVPDIYQGDELSYQALVDPDNRRPVDWRLRQSLLARLLGGAQPTAQTFKLWLISRLLGLRIRRPSAFTGGYEPVSAGEHAVAYVRGGEVLVVVATRPGATPGRPGAPAGRLAAIGGRWRSVLGGEERSLGVERSLGGVLDEHGIGVYERI